MEAPQRDPNLERGRDMAENGSNTGLVVVIIVLVAALLFAVFYWRGGNGSQDAELKIDVNSSGGNGGMALVQPSLVPEPPEEFVFTA